MPSYRKHSIKGKARRVMPKKSILKRPWFWLTIFIFLAVICFLYFGLFYSGVQVNNVIVSGGEKINPSELKNFTFSNISIGIINAGALKLASRSIFFVNPKNLEDKVLSEFPFVEKIEIRRKFPDSLVLEITERDPIGAYCPGEEFEQICFLIDKNGIIFEQLTTEPNDLIIIRQGSSGDSLFEGKRAIGEDTARAILRIQKSLKENFQISLKQASITNPLRLDALTNEGWKIFFNLGGDADIGLQILKLNLLLDSEISSDARQTLQYIDLRFKDRAFYK